MPPPGTRGFYGSWPQIGVPAGLVLSTAVFTLFSRLPEAQFLAWGWRVPFLLSALLVVVGLIMGVVYFAVDYGIYYQALGTRHISGADPFWFLLWFSMSYGLTNFAWIWLLLDRDGRAVEWSLLPILGWVTVAALARQFGGGYDQISVSRGVRYHGVMTAISP